MRSRPLLSSAFALTLLAGTALLAPSASAQPSGPSAPYFPPSEHRHASSTARTLVARHMARIGVLSIRSAGAAPTPNDFVLAATILDAAAELDPGNLDFLRRSIDAWHGAGEHDVVAARTARLVELDPRDRVAQLRLLSLRINELQTADQRIAAYDRILGPSGSSLDPAIRSRLALDAALLARERGDHDGFLARLTRATQLDSTNKDAAALAASLVLDSTPDPLARAEALLNVVLADPMDANSHANLSRELRHAGAFRAAQRFQDNADAIMAAEGRYFDPQVTHDRLLTLWGAQGAEAVADALDERERMMRTQRTNEVAAYQAAGRQPPPGPAPEQVTLEPILEVLRASANICQSRSSRVETTARLLTREAEAVQRAIAEASQRGAPAAQLNESSARLTVILSELLWLRLWAGVQIPEAQGLLASMRNSGLMTDPAVVARYEGILAVRTGDFAAAEAKLTPLVEFDPRARVGLAMLEEARGNPRAAAAHLAPLALEQTGSMLGLYARSTIERLLAQPVRASQAALRLEEYFNNVPRWLDAMTRDPREFMVIESEWPSNSISTLDGLPLTIRLRNIGRVALPIGPNLTVNSRLLLSPDPTIGGQRPPNRLTPEVAEFARDLRVLPGESTEITVQAGIGPIGIALDNAASQVATLRMQIAQGFVVDPQGVYYKGPTSVSATTPLLTRRRFTIPDESPAGIRRALDGAQGDRVLEVLAVFRDLTIRTLAMEDRQLALEIGNAIVQTVAEHMPHMSEVERAAAVLLVGSVYPRDLLTPIDQMGFSDPSMLVRTVTLVGRVNDPEHPAFDALLADGSDSLDRLTSSLRQRLIDARAAAQRQAELQAQQGQQGQGRPQQPQQGRPQQNPAAQPPANSGGGLRFDPSSK